MDIRDRRGLKAAAREDLAAASYEPRKLILIHTGVTVVLALIIGLLDYLLEQQIGGTGGLGGVGTRAMLETMRTVLTMVQGVAVLFWQIGYVFVALKISRRETVGTGSLLEGFRRFGPVLRLRILTALLYAGPVMLCVYGASIIYTMTPWAQPLLEAYQTGSEEAMYQAMMDGMLPMTGISLALSLVILVPYAYGLRLADHAIMDRGNIGAMTAVRVSRVLMRGNRLALLKLDLSFWWFYALEMLTLLVADGPVILLALGVELPWSADAAYYIFMVLCYLLQLALYWWRGNEILVTYARFYGALMPEDEES